MEFYYGFRIAACIFTPLGIKGSRFEQQLKHNWRGAYGRARAARSRRPAPLSKPPRPAMPCAGSLTFHPLLSKSPLLLHTPIFGAFRTTGHTHRAQNAHSRRRLAHRVLREVPRRHPRVSVSSVSAASSLMGNENADFIAATCVVANVPNHYLTTLSFWST